MEKARGKGLEESVTGRAGLSREQPASIVFSCILYMYRYVLLLSCLTSCKVHAVLGCSSGLILRDCGAIYNDRSRRAVREASTVVKGCAVGAYVNLTAVGAFQCSRMVIMSVLS